MLQSIKADPTAASSQSWWNSLRRVCGLFYQKMSLFFWPRPTSALICCVLVSYFFPALLSEIQPQIFWTCRKVKGDRNHGRPTFTSQFVFEFTTKLSLTCKKEDQRSPTTWWQIVERASLLTFFEVTNILIWVSEKMERAKARCWNRTHKK